MSVYCSVLQYARQHNVNCKQLAGLDFPATDWQPVRGIPCLLDPPGDLDKDKWKRMYGLIPENSHNYYLEKSRYLLLFHDPSLSPLNK